MKTDHPLDFGDDDSAYLGSPPGLEFAKFLESALVGVETKMIKSVWQDGRDESICFFKQETLPKFYCNVCKSDVPFKLITDVGDEVTTNKTATRFLEFRCRGCESDSYAITLQIKPYVIAVEWQNEYSDSVYEQAPSFTRERRANVTKISVWPRPIPKLDNRSRTLLGSSFDFYVKGLNCEQQGLGVAAFTYYRRLIEESKDKLLSAVVKIIEANPRSDQREASLRDLHSAMGEDQFSKSMSLAMPHVPQSILLDGDNPFRLLHGFVSDGIHNKSDEDCLQKATAVRLVIASLLRRLSELQNDESELREALRVLKAPRPKPAKPARRSEQEFGG